MLFKELEYKEKSYHMIQHLDKKKLHKFKQNIARLFSTNLSMESGIRNEIDNEKVAGPDKGIIYNGKTWMTMIIYRRSP